MAIEQTIEKPSRLLTFLNENNDKRVVEWVIDTVTDSSVLTNWDSIVDLGEEDVDTVNSISNSDNAAQKDYNVLTSSSGGNITWHIDTGMMSNGATCSMVGSDPFVPVTSLEDFNRNDLSIYKNGVLLQKGVDVTYDYANTFILSSYLEEGDWLSIVKLL
jgi:hypothetical protein